MDRRAADLIVSLGLTPHPEGGYFRELHRSSSRVQPLDGRSPRPALTTIWFLLVAGNVSRWHSVASDEVWHYYEGAPLDLMTADPRFVQVAHHPVGPLGDGCQPEHVVAADMWQAARSTGAYTLVGCVVGPGFEFADFQLLRDRPSDAETLGRRHPEVAQFV